MVHFWSQMSPTSYVALTAVGNFSKQHNIECRTACSCRAQGSCFSFLSAHAFLSVWWIQGCNSPVWPHASSLYVSFCCSSVYQFPFCLVPHLPVPWGSPTPWRCLCAGHSAQLSQGWRGKLSSLATSFPLICNLLFLFLMLGPQGAGLESFCHLFV